MTASSSESPGTASIAVPFVGLRPFDVGDQRWFFGRVRETAALVGGVRDHRFTAVIGASGSGKSSLVRAGVIPVLVGEGWRPVVTTPGAEPIARLAKRLAAAAATEEDPLGEARRYRFDASLRASCFGLAEIASGFPPENELRVLVVDQFEELFRYGEEARGGTAAAMREEARAFVELLLTAAAAAGRLNIVITMRSDFFGNCAAYPGLAEAVSRSQYLVPVPGRDQLEEAIRRPIDAAGATIDGALVQRLLIDVEEETDKLPLLQHTLRRLWESAAGASRHLGESEYAAVGGLAGSIDVQASRIAERLEGDTEHPGDGATLKQLMQALTDFDTHGRATRRPQKRSALIELLADGNPARSNAVTASLDRAMEPLRAEDTSFLRIGLEESDPVVDIGHEALIRSWRRLSGPDRDFASGWLREEARDGLNYRYIRQHVLSSPGQPLSGSPISWWGARNPTGKWAERYGGDFDRISAAVYQAAPELRPLPVAGPLPAPDTDVSVGLSGATAESKAGSVVGDMVTGIFETVLEVGRPATYQWWRTGLKRALSVASVRTRGGSRIASGFLLRAGDLGLEPGEELLVLTCFHAISDQMPYAIRPEDAEVVFEAVDPDRTYTVKQIVWSSPVDRHDASLLRLEPLVTGVEPLPIAPALPVLDGNARVYIIGHPGGRDLAFSFADNELLDHEGPPAGHPQISGVVRIHYRAPTEGGSGGSPVFNSRLWQVIAMHHKGGKIGMPRLNGKEGTYGANEGIGIQSIVAAIKGGLN